MSDIKVVRSTRVDLKSTITHLASGQKIIVQHVLNLSSRSAEWNAGREKYSFDWSNIFLIHKKVGLHWCPAESLRRPCEQHDPAPLDHWRVSRNYECLLSSPELHLKGWGTDREQPTSCCKIQASDRKPSMPSQWQASDHAIRISEAVGVKTRASEMTEMLPVETMWAN